MQFVEREVQQRRQYESLRGHERDCDSTSEQAGTYQAQLSALPAAGLSHIQGCLRLSAVRRARAGVVPLCSTLGRRLLRNCAQFQASQLRREIDQLKRVQPRATNTVGKLKHEMYRDTEGAAYVARRREGYEGI